MTVLKPVSKWTLAAFMITAGVMHFVADDFFLKVVPTYLPWPEVIVSVSGVIEIVLGLLLVLPKTTRFAAWALIVFFVAVFPANIHVFYNQHLFSLPHWLHIVRLPLQAVLIFWAYWHTIPADEPKTPPGNPSSSAL
ncbi:DoxX family protein [Thalassoroseus pseudoceratinae]|uniref:DoxX family protein n=1 Tax=Thalassoroseus pseudoceratinae TaxID=2713176 RepID=UPI001422F0F7|nr:DoxX family membrane protein [Thalassoroseus pseudoceratinae]